MSQDLTPKWIAALHGHAYVSEETTTEPVAWRVNNPWKRATCVCGWKGADERYEDYEPALEWEWNDHVLFAIATAAVRV